MSGPSQVKKYQRRQQRREQRSAQEILDRYKFFTVEEIAMVLALHPADCVFELDAPRRIAQRLSIRPKVEWMADHVSEMRNCFIQSEIYCPHEGVDRLIECGVDLDWEHFE